MIRLLADEDFDHNILRGVLRRNPDLDIVSVQESGLSGREDPFVLEWAASEGRPLLTHDANTMTAYAYARVNANLIMPGVFVVRRTLPIADVIEELLTLAEYSDEGDWNGKVSFLPVL
jgi:hypothetical protein